MTLLQRYSKHLCPEAGKTALCANGGNRDHWDKLYFCRYIGHVMMRSLLENWEEKDHALLENKCDELQMPKNDG